MLKKITTLALALALSTTTAVNAQNIGNALQFGAYAKYYNAEFAGGAVPGWRSATLFNPSVIAKTGAGIQFAGGYAGVSTNSYFAGQSAIQTNVAKPIFSSASLVVKLCKCKQGNWTLGFGYNSENMGYTIAYEGVDTKNLVTETYNQLGPNFDPNGLTGLAKDYWNVQAWYPVTGIVAPYTHDFASVPSAPVVRRQSLVLNGRVSEFTGVFGGMWTVNGINISGGIKLAYLTSRFGEENTLREFDAFDTIPYFTEQTRWERFKASGQGGTISAGVNVEAGPYFRLGLSAQAPRIMVFTEDSIQSSLNYQYRDLGVDHSNDAISDISKNRYRLTTAPSVTMSGSFGSKEWGAINLDITYIWNNAIKFGTVSGNNGFEATQHFSHVNEMLQNNLKPSVNFSLGGKVNLSVLSLTAGFESIGNVYRTANTAKWKPTSYHVGIGFTGNIFYVSTMYRWGNTTNVVSAFPGATDVISETAFGNANLTLGFWFGGAKKK